MLTTFKMSKLPTRSSDSSIALNASVYDDSDGTRVAGVVAYLKIEDVFETKVVAHAGLTITEARDLAARLIATADEAERAVAKKGHDEIELSSERDEHISLACSNNAQRLRKMKEKYKKVIDHAIVQIRRNRLREQTDIVMRVMEGFESQMIEAQRDLLALEAGASRLDAEAEKRKK